VFNLFTKSFFIDYNIIIFLLKFMLVRG